MACVSNSVLHPERALASAASVPAWPPPITITSNLVGKSIAKRRYGLSKAGREFYVIAQEKATNGRRKNASD
jgi:hypothetical protein